MCIRGRFFVSHDSRARPAPVQGQVTRTVLRQVVETRSRSVPFGMVVFLPLVPTFRTTIGQTRTSSLHVVVRTRCDTVDHKPRSVVTRLATQKVGMSRCVSFCSLHGFSFLSKGPVARRLCVRSGLLVISSLITVLKSTGVGSQDVLKIQSSRFTVVIRSKRRVPTLLGKRPAAITHTIHTLQIHLFRRRLKLLSLPFASPLIRVLGSPATSKFCGKILHGRTSLGARVFQRLFRYIPSSYMSS